MKTTDRQDLVGALVCLQDLVLCPQRHDFDIHIVAVEVIEYDHAIVFHGGGVRETAGLIREDLAGCREALREHCVGAPAALRRGVR